MKPYDDALDPLAAPREPGAAQEDAYLQRAVASIAVGHDQLLDAPPGDRWVERARRHGVLGPVAAALVASGHELPSVLSGYRISAAIQRMQADRDLRELGDALDAQGIGWAVVKGPVLDKIVYRSAGTRESADLDLLVAPVDVQRTVRAFSALGMTVLGADWTQPTWSEGAEIPMQTAQATIVDLHWHLINSAAMRRRFAVHTEPLLARRRSRTIGELAISTLDDLDLVLHVLLHASLDGCGRLRALLDAQQSIDWLRREGRTPSELASRAGELRVDAPARSVLAVTAHHLDGSVLPWLEAMSGSTAWTRGLRRWEQRHPERSPLRNGLARRLHRYVAPTSVSSMTAVNGYALGRVRRLVRGDVTDLTLRPTDLADPAFRRYLDRLAPT